ncbi:unnamed protein product [Rotaria magnacalcarata]|uniref:Endonuclease/exonuclease/phosphatase domain-containing protein n=1 Tax=Rotaria magnacalcarata TaxID=392030 RepID=A0A816GZG8_9BILA|nr:unnamed protein product [Rotaria magnacalcarata]CAF1680171.1 unnamed protein product [Rotaria magnacalcarata]
MTRIWKHMNPSANEFIPDLNVSYDISTNHLTTKQKNILLEIISKWTTTPTLDDLLLRREERKNVSCPIIVFNGTHHDDAAIKNFSKHFNNYNIYSQKGTNKFRGVLTAVHRSIAIQRVNVFQRIPNVLVLDIGTSHDKFQLATCYSLPNESLPLAIFEQITKRNKNTILLGDFNAKHQSWSKSNENQKGRVLFN